MGTMSGSFNRQILVDKLTKLNNSQQSIETLSHWCIFHRNKAKEVVETWNRQFYCSAQDKRLYFLYLANDILQNSRRKGWEFVDEFWKVLPGALNDVNENGDDSAKRAVSRLVHIWEERRVFGSNGQLEEELLGRNRDSRNRNGTVVSYKLKHPAGDMLEKFVSCYEHIYDGLVDEDVLYGKCQNAINFVEKLENDIMSGLNIGNIEGSGIVEQLHGKHDLLRECVEKLKAAESSRSTLLSHLIEALHEQEFKLDQVRKQLQTAQSWHDQVGNICQQLLSRNSGQPLPEAGLEVSPLAFSGALSSFTSEAPASRGDKEQSVPASYTQQGHLANSLPSSEEENWKTAVAVVAAKLTPSTYSAQVRSNVLSPLALGIIGQSVTDDYISDSKRTRLDDGVPSYSSMQLQPPPPPPPFPHPDSLYQPPPPSSPMTPPSLSMPPQLPLPESLPSPMQHPPPPLPDTLPPPMQHPPPPLPDTLPPMPLPPLPPTIPFMQTVRPMSGMPYFYTSRPPLQRPLPIPSYPMGMPAPYPCPLNPYYTFQGAESGGVFGQPPLPTGSSSISHQ